MAPLRERPETERCRGRRLSRHSMPGQSPMPLPVRTIDAEDPRISERNRPLARRMAEAPSR